MRFGLPFVLVFASYGSAHADPRLWEIELRRATIQYLDEHNAPVGVAREIKPTAVDRVSCRIEKRPSGVYKTWFRGLIETDGEGTSHLTFIDERGGPSDDIETCAAQVVANMKFSAKAGAARLVATVAFKPSTYRSPLP
jgi:hypothetical protein